MVVGNLRAQIDKIVSNLPVEHALAGSGLQRKLDIRAEAMHSHTHSIFKRVPSLESRVSKGVLNSQSQREKAGALGPAGKSYRDDIGITNYHTQTDDAQRTTGLPRVTW
jgi:hypothetical protein